MDENDRYSYKRLVNTLVATLLLEDLKTLFHEFFPQSDTRAVQKLSRKELQYLLNGEVIFAIRELRSRTTFSLMDAKTIIDLARGYPSTTACPHCQGRGVVNPTSEAVKSFLNTTE